MCNNRFKTFLKDGGYDAKAIIKSSPLPADLRSGLQVWDEMIRLGKGRPVTPATGTVSRSPASSSANVPQRTAPQTYALVAVRLWDRYNRHRNEPRVNVVMDVATLPRKNHTDATVDSLIEAERRVNNRQYIAVHSYHSILSRKMKKPRSTCLSSIQRHISGQRRCWTSHWTEIQFSLQTLKR